MKKRSNRRCAACIQNEKDRKAARKAAAAKKKAESMCDCDGKCGRDGCDGGVCGNKVTQSHASKCTKCSNAVKKQRETCATCGDKTCEGVCSCVAEYMQRVEPESTPTSDLFEGLRPRGVLFENYERMESVKTVSGKRQLNRFRSTILLPHAARYLYRVNGFESDDEYLPELVPFESDASDSESEEENDTTTTTTTTIDDTGVVGQIGQVGEAADSAAFTPEKGDFAVRKGERVRVVFIDRGAVPWAYTVALPDGREFGTELSKLTPPVDC